MSETALRYQNLALRWSPKSRLDQDFHAITAITLGAALAIGFLVSIVKLPKEERLARPPVPERVAQFLLQKERPKPKPAPEIEPLPKPILKTLKKPPEVKAPLTKEEKKALDKAKTSGLLALRGDLAGLVDTASISKMVSGKTTRANAASSQAAGHDKDVLSAGSGKGSAGVDAGRYATAGGGQTRLSEREITVVRQTLLAGKSAGADDKGAARVSGGTGRSEDELSVAFDRNKGSLYAVYDRARRKNPGLKGKIVLELTVSPSGDVTNVRIVSSELGDTELEQNLLRRIRTFNFGTKNVKPITVTYPIEFLPS